MPAVFFDNVPSQPGAGAVAMDNEAGIRLLVDHLVAVHGHERIAYLGPAGVARHRPALLQGTGRERLEAFRAAVGRAGLPLPPEYVRTSEPALLRGERPRRRARADGAGAAADRDRRRHRRARHRPAARAARRGAAGARTTSRSSRSTSRCSADLLDPPITSLDRHDAQLGRLAAEALLRTLRGEAAAMGIAPRPRRAQRPPLVRVRR